VKLLRRKRLTTEPQGVRVRCQDGSVTECWVLRDPDQDKNGCAAWIAVPQGLLTSPPSVLSVDMLPGKTVIILEMPADSVTP
jgi:hypothetical protein